MNKKLTTRNQTERIILKTDTKVKRFSLESKGNLENVWVGDKIRTSPKAAAQFRLSPQFSPGESERGRRGFVSYALTSPLENNSKK